MGTTNVPCSVTLSASQGLHTAIRPAPVARLRQREAGVCVAMSTTRQRVQHLLRRAGFGYRADELDQYLALGLEGAVERLLAPESVDDSAADAEVQALDLSDLLEKRIKLFQAWHVRARASRRPLLEKMTYFWHDHFATAIHKVGHDDPMQLQNETLRSRALGSFRDLLLAIARDPAMMRWLDNQSNSVEAPNENYARELMELHTLGEGNGYSELDIKEAARALTGWRATRHGVCFIPRLHDFDKKTVLGVTGHLSDEGVIDLLAGRRETADYVGDKLWRFFAIPDPEPELLRRTTDAYLASDGSIRELLRVILLSEEMYSERAYRTRIKSPVELVIGAERALEVVTDGRPGLRHTRGMGQLLYDPPDPAGWEGDAAWVNSTTMLARSNFANELTRVRRRRGADIPALLERYGVIGSADEVVDWTCDLLVGGDVDAETRKLLADHLGGSFHFDFARAARDGTGRCTACSTSPSRCPCTRSRSERARSGDPHGQP